MAMAGRQFSPSGIRLDKRLIAARTGLLPPPAWQPVFSLRILIVRISCLLHLINEARNIDSQEPRIRFSVYSKAELIQIS